MNLVTICENVYEPATWETVEVNDVREFCTERFSSWPVTAKLFLDSVSKANDVTPYDESSVAHLAELKGHFYIVVFPEGIETIFIIVAIAIAALAVGLSFLLRPHVTTNIPANQQNQSPNNELSNRQNKERPNERIPDIFGKLWTTPDLIAQPYRIFDVTGTEIEYANYCIGRGSYTIDKVRDDLTPISQIAGASVEVYGPFTSPNSGTPALRIGAAIGEPVRAIKPSSAVNGQTLIAPNLTGGGLFTGSFIVGDANTTDIWFNFVASSGAYQVPSSTGVQAAVTVTLQVGVTPVDASGAATGAEVLTSVNLVGSATLKQRVGVTLKYHCVTAGLQSVRAKRTSNTNIAANTSVSDETQWRDCLAVNPVTQTDFGNVTTVQTLTLPTPTALALKQRKLQLLVTRNVPIGSLTAGVVTFGDSGPSKFAGDIMTAIATDPYIGNRPLSEVDTAEIYTTLLAAQTYFGTGLVTNFCFTFDDKTVSFEDMFSDVATSSFCQAYRRGSILSVSFEQKTANSKLIFNHRNKLPGSETRTVTFGRVNDIDGIELTYNEPNDPAFPNQDTPKTITFPIGGAPVNPKRISTVGIRNNVQAYMLGWRLYNKLIYQNTVTQFNSTQEASLAIINDRILNADNTRQDTQDGEVVDANALLLTLSQNVVFVAGRTYTIFLQHYDETVEALAITAGAVPPESILFADWDSTKAYRINDRTSFAGVNYVAITTSTNLQPNTNPAAWQIATITNQVLLAGAPLLPVVVDVNLYVRTTYIIVDNVAARSAAFLVTEKTPQDGMTYQVKAINYDDRYYLKDTDFINGIVISNGESGEIGLAVAAGATYRPSLFNDLNPLSGSSGLANNAGVCHGFNIRPPDPNPEAEIGDVLWNGFAPVRITTNTTLSVVVSGVTGSGHTLTLNGTVLSISGAGTYTAVIPANTYLSSVLVEAKATAAPNASASITVTDISIT